MPFRFLLLHGTVGVLTVAIAIIAALLLAVWIKTWMYAPSDPAARSGSCITFLIFLPGMLYLAMLQTLTNHGYSGNVKIIGAIGVIIFVLTFAITWAAAKK